MHYKNGRSVAIGDWVVGISHNSENQTVCGIVLSLMPAQGPCNIKIHRWRSETDNSDGAPSHTTPAHETRGIEDYGDAKEFIRVDDGLRMVNAVVKFGDWDGNYFEIRPFQH